MQTEPTSGNDATVRDIRDATRRTMRGLRRLVAEDRFEDLRTPNAPGAMAEHRFHLWEEPYLLRESHGITLSLEREIAWHGTHRWTLGQAKTGLTAATLSLFAGMPTMRLPRTYHRIHAGTGARPKAGDPLFGFAYDRAGTLLAIHAIPAADASGEIGPSIELWKDGEGFDAGTQALADHFRRCLEAIGL